MATSSHSDLLHNFCLKNLDEIGEKECVRLMKKFDNVNRSENIFLHYMQTISGEIELIKGYVIPILRLFYVSFKIHCSRFGGRYSLKLFSHRDS